MMQPAYLEVRRWNGTKFYAIYGEEDLKVLRYWKSIDCGCRAYASARATTWPTILSMLERLEPEVAPVPPYSELFKVIA